MDNDPHEHTQLEAELTRLRPRAPSRASAESIGRRLTPRRTAISWWTCAALPLAAAVTGAFFFVARRDGGPAPAARVVAAAFKPIAAENFLVTAVDEGAVTLEDGTPARRVRSNYIDTLTWKDPRSQAKLKWSVPREEVRVVPVIFQ